jgi:hypothetical protein
MKSLDTPPFLAGHVLAKFAVTNMSSTCGITYIFKLCLCESLSDPL